MPEGRFVNKRISENEQLGAVSLQADMLFTKCIPHLDVSGRITGNPVLLKSRVLPLRAEVTIEAIPGLIDELQRAVGHEGDPLVRAYVVNGQAVLEFPGFVRQQKGLKPDREAASRLPEQQKPAELLRTVRKRAKSRSGPTPEQVGSESGEDPPNISLSEEEVESKRSEGVGRENAALAVRGGWPAQVAAIFAEHVGVVEPGECGRWLGEAVQTHGEAAVLRAAASWAQEAPLTEKPHFLTPKSLARQIGVWIQRSRPVEVYDPVTGDITPEAARLLGRAVT